MQFSLNMTHPHMIKSHSNSDLTLVSGTFKQNLILTPDTIQLLEKPISHPSQVDFDDITPFLQGDLLILGHHAPDFLHHFSLQARLLKEQQMGFEIMTIGSACRTFNILLTEERPASLLIIFPA